jgi:hypothetical protein
MLINNVFIEFRVGLALLDLFFLEFRKKMGFPGSNPKKKLNYVSALNFLLTKNSDQKN